LENHRSRAAERGFVIPGDEQMATSLSAALLGSTALPPPRAKRARPYRVEIHHRREPNFFDVVVCGIVVRGCSVYGEGEARRVRCPGFEFESRAAKDEFNHAVLAALDAGE
jgi:hypothetical protein